MSSPEAGAGALFLPSPDWEARLAQLWASLDDHDEADFRRLVEELVAELPEGSAIADFERACAHDSTGQEQEALLYYRRALETGLEGERLRRGVIQLASTQRNVGRPDLSIVLLTNELEVASDHLDDAVKAFLALALADTGAVLPALSLALQALAPHLPRYQRSVASYARALIEDDTQPNPPSASAPSA